MTEGGALDFRPVVDLRVEDAKSSSSNGLVLIVEKNRSASARRAHSSP